MTQSENQKQELFNQELAMQLIESTEEFPIDFDVAWQWLDYSRKDSAKRHFLKANFLKDIDYRSFHTTVEREIGATTTEKILLTVECLKLWAMMANTEQGLLVRKYFLECEKIAKQKTTAIKPMSQAEMFFMVAETLLKLEKDAALTNAIAIEANSTAKLADGKADQASADAKQALLATAENSLEVAKNTQALEELKAAMVSLENTVSKFSNAGNLQSKRNLLNEFIQHLGIILSIKYGLSKDNGMRRAWNSLGVKLRNSIHKFDLNLRIANEKRVYNQQLEQWEKNGKPRGQKPNKPTRSELLENNQKLEAALECCTLLAAEVVVN
jgi:phage anti-repressor protein